MIAYIYTTMLTGERKRARTLISDWHIGRNSVLKLALYAASIMPAFILQWVFGQRMKRF